jgi:hypothetical protein
MAYGTLSTLDSLAATQQSIAAYGEDRAWEDVAAALAAHTNQMNAMMAPLLERTTDRQRRYGTAASRTMQVADQFGRPQAQKITAGATLGFPLRLYEDALQWTRKFMQAPGSAQQLAAEFDAILDADRRLVLYEMKRALMTPTNYTFNDVLVDNVQLAVKALANADGASIPLGPNGESFDGSTHSHYLYTSGTSLAAADVSAGITTVREHTAMGVIQVWINSAQESAMRGLTGFVPHLYGYIQRGGGATDDATNQALSVANPNDRSIGFFGEAEVFVKSWWPSGYLGYVNVGAAQAPLVMRTREGQGDLVLVFDDEDHPLRARAYEREFGIGVHNRVAVAVQYIDSGNGGAYVAPALTM